MKIALVGLGYWGEKILRNLVGIVGLDGVLAIDFRADRVESAAKAYPGASFSDTAEAMLDDEVSAVIVASDVESHAALAAQALNAGRHVLVEKPLATTTVEATQLAALADRRGLTLMVGHTFLFSPRVGAVAGVLRKNQIGRVQYVTTSRLNLGLYRRDINVIWDLAPHDFSILFYLLQEYPIRIHTAARSSVAGGIEDVAFIDLVFPSGVIASVVVSWRAPRKVRTTMLVGDLGMVAYDDTNPDEPVKVYDRGVVVTDSASFGENQLTYRYGDTVAPHVAPHEPLLLELEHFVHSMTSGEPCRSDGWFGLEVVRALEAADHSWRIGSLPVEIESAVYARTLSG